MSTVQCQWVMTKTSKRCEHKAKYPIETPIFCGYHKSHIPFSQEKEKEKREEEKGTDIVKETPSLLEIKHQSVYIYLSENQTPSPSKLALFDLDGTLIRTRSGQTFPQSIHDWKLNYPNVKEILLQYIEQGFKLIVVSNQSRFVSDEFAIKIGEIHQTLQLPQISYYVATEKDNFRKPMIDLWGLILNHGSEGRIHPDSFFCGDAAGRKGDFNITDRYFAENIGLNFYTPEEIFLKETPQPFMDPYQSEIDLEQWVTTDEIPKLSEISGKTPFLILMVGPQACGKSTFSRKLMELFQITYLNRDTIRSTAKLQGLFETAVSKRENIVIDNTNPKEETRKIYIDYAKKIDPKYHIFCYFFDFPKKMVFHLNQMRVQITHGKTPLIPHIAIHSYFKSLIKPTIEEGFEQIITVSHLHLTPQEKEDRHFPYWYHYDPK